MQGTRSSGPQRSWALWPGPSGMSLLQHFPAQSLLPLAIVGGALLAAGPLLTWTHRRFNNNKVGAGAWG